MNSDHENECTFPSSTFKVEENKVPLFFGSDIIWGRYKLFVILWFHEDKENPPYKSKNIKKLIYPSYEVWSLGSHCFPISLGVLSDQTKFRSFGPLLPLVLHPPPQPLGSHLANSLWIDNLPISLQQSLIHEKQWHFIFFNFKSWRK